MTNPNDAIGTNAAYGSRTSVNAFNDIAQLVNGSGILSGFSVVPKTGMTVSVGGVAGTRDVAVAEDNLGNRTCINNRSVSSIDVTIAAAGVSSNRYDAIVVYANNPAQASDTTPDAPSVCGIIAVEGGSTGVSENQIRSAITADGGTGSVAYYAVLATIYVGAGTTTITSSNITQSHIAISASDIADGEIISRMIAAGAISVSKIETATLDAIGSYSTSEVATPFKWIDGKTIYKKTIEFGALPNNNSKNVPHGITNLGTVISAEGYATSSWGVQYPIPAVYTSTDSQYNTQIAVDSTNITLSSVGNNSTKEGIVTIFYTKAS